LEPASRIIQANPPFATPFGERLAGGYAEVIQRWIRVGSREFCARKPAPWKFIFAISHIFAAENTKAEHFGWREFGTEFRVKVAPNRFNARVLVSSLHSVIDRYSSFDHCALSFCDLSHLAVLSCRVIPD
jgi:hypothetical protein